jgi:hypothetical protein
MDWSGKDKGDRLDHWSFRISADSWVMRSRLKRFVWGGGMLWETEKLELHAWVTGSWSYYRADNLVGSAGLVIQRRSQECSSSEYRKR